MTLPCIQVRCCLLCILLFCVTQHVTGEQREVALVAVAFSVVSLHAAQNFTVRGTEVCALPCDSLSWLDMLLIPTEAGALTVVEQRVIGASTNGTHRVTTHEASVSVVVNPRISIAAEYRVCAVGVTWCARACTARIGFVPTFNDVIVPHVIARQGERMAVDATGAPLQLTAHHVTVPPYSSHNDTLFWRLTFTVGRDVPTVHTVFAAACNCTVEYDGVQTVTRTDSVSGESVGVDVGNETFANVGGALVSVQTDLFDLNYSLASRLHNATERVLPSNARLEFYFASAGAGVTGGISLQATIPLVIVCVANLPENTAATVAYPLGAREYLAVTFPFRKARPFANAGVVGAEGALRVTPVLELAEVGGGARGGVVTRVAAARCEVSVAGVATVCYWEDREALLCAWNSSLATVVYTAIYYDDMFTWKLGHSVTVGVTASRLFETDMLACNTIGLNLWYAHNVTCELRIGAVASQRGNGTLGGRLRVLPVADGFGGANQCSAVETSLSVTLTVVAATGGLRFVIPTPALNYKAVVQLEVVTSAVGLGSGGVVASNTFVSFFPPSVAGMLNHTLYSTVTSGQVNAGGSFAFSFPIAHVASKAPIMFSISLGLSQGPAGGEKLRANCTMSVTQRRFDCISPGMGSGGTGLSPGLYIGQIPWHVADAASSTLRQPRVCIGARLETLNTTLAVSLVDDLSNRRYTLRWDPQFELRAQPSEPGLETLLGSDSSVATASLSSAEQRKFALLVVGVAAGTVLFNAVLIWMQYLIQRN